jgi:hypothetical protein
MALSSVGYASRMGRIALPLNAAHFTAVDAGIPGIEGRKNFSPPGRREKQKEIKNNARNAKVISRSTRLRHVNPSPVQHVVRPEKQNMATPGSAHMSSLSRVVSRDGYCVEVRIYEDGEAAWLLQIVDDQGCMTGWIESFVSDQAAFDEAMRAIEEEGITSFIGSVSGAFPWPANEYLPDSRTLRCKETQN